MNTKNQTNLRQLVIGKYERLKKKKKKRKEKKRKKKLSGSVCLPEGFIVHIPTT